jgi:hypothetical protein
MPRSIPTEDRISSLRDPIICHILSFLPTKIYAATSILSKRWKPLWLSVPALHFDDETFPNYDSFFRIVSSIFLSRDITLPVRSFCLKFSQTSTHHSHDINLFVHAVAQRRGIENLNLEISSMLFCKVQLPPSIFSCKTLVVLNLKGLNVNDLSQLVLDFPLLKTLHLWFMCFKGLGHLVKLLSGCPLLEELLIRSMYVENANEPLVSAENFQCLPNLIRANIYGLLFRNVNVLITLLCIMKTEKWEKWFHSS